MELVVVPTRLELERLLALGDETAERLRSGLDPNPEVETRVCGFGAIAAAASIAERLALGGVDSVTLLGIAGTYAPARTPVGSAHVATAVHLAEAGAGTGEQHVDLRTLGFPLTTVRDQPVFDQLLCPRREAPRPESTSDAPARECVHLTVHSASGSIEHAETRARQYPRAEVEEMEGFGVALACIRVGVGCTLIRGISNAAGDRDVANWAIDPALRSAGTLWLQVRNESA